MNKENTKLSKFISLILRHQPEVINLKLDDNGWADTEKLIEGIKESGRKITFEQLKEIVETNDKKRFKFNDDYTKIRANQGHSIKVDVELKECIPLDTLYHGTATRFIDSIKKQGIRPQNRLYVHLSKDLNTAIKVGMRHGKVIVLVIDAKKMSEDGYIFYLSENNVWLVKEVLPEYIVEYVDE